MRTVHGCPAFSTTAWITFLSDRPFILGSILIVFGAVVTFFGRKFFQYTVAVMGAGLGFLTTMLLFSIMGMLDGLENEKDSVFMTVFSFLIAIIVALFLAFIMYKTIKFGAMILGAVCGNLIGITLYNLVMSSSESFYLLLFVTIFFGVLGAYLAYRFFDIIVILSTALIGAYSFVRGISMFAGHFPNEMILI
jgi:hypothetical protein